MPRCRSSERSAFRRWTTRTRSFRPPSAGACSPATRAGASGSSRPRSRTRTGSSSPLCRTMHSPKIRRSCGATSCAARVGSTSSSPACPKTLGSTEAFEREDVREARQREPLAVPRGDLVHRAQRLLALARLRHDVRAHGREVADEGFRARLPDRLDPAPGRLNEPRLARQLFLAVGLVSRKADELGELALQRIALVPPVPEQGQAAAGADYAVQLGHGLLAVEPVVRLPREGAVDALVPKRDRLRRPPEPLRLRHGQPKLLEHRAARLDRRDREAEGDEAAG